MDFLFVYISNFPWDMGEMWISRDRNADVFFFSLYVLENIWNFFSKLTKRFGNDAATEILSSKTGVGKHPFILNYYSDNRQNHLETYHDVNGYTRSNKR